MFASIAFLGVNQFDAIALGLFIAQSLANAMKIQDIIAMSCFQLVQHLHTTNGPLEQIKVLISKIGIPYSTSGVEGFECCLLWLSHIF